MHGMRMEQCIIYSITYEYLRCAVVFSISFPSHKLKTVFHLPTLQQTCATQNSSKDHIKQIFFRGQHAVINAFKEVILPVVVST